MRIDSISCLQDNYAYLLICEQTKSCAVVDPSEAGPVLAEIKAQGLRVEAIWNTHHHFDHVGGNEALLELFPEATVVGHESDKGRVPGQTLFAVQGDSVAVGEEVKASIIFNPGHTTGAISYYLEEPGAVFTGDTLFAAGCGRLFEGTIDQMHDSLTRLTELPPETKVYCGHEYTQSNLRFAAAVEPDNAEIQARAERVAAQREAGESTMGFTVSEERATNIFVRTAEPVVRAAAEREEEIGDGRPAEIFGALRRWKDRF
jgi:hydroxyacylglutathione hydrolase